MIHDMKISVMHRKRKKEKKKERQARKRETTQNNAAKLNQVRSNMTTRPCIGTRQVKKVLISIYLFIKENIF